jgi:hypothetical protein
LQRSALPIATLPVQPAAPLALSFVTHTRRDCAIHQLEEICHAGSVFILDFNMFSNLSLTRQFEADAAALQSTIDELLRHGFTIQVECQAAIASLRDLASDAKTIGTLQVTFANEDGSLRIPVPAVPG